jgi:hypothetical protein
MVCRCEGGKKRELKVRCLDVEKVGSIAMRMRRSVRCKQEMKVEKVRYGNLDLHEF